MGTACLRSCCCGQPVEASRYGECIEKQSFLHKDDSVFCPSVDAETDHAVDTHELEKLEASSPPRFANIDVGLQEKSTPPTPSANLQDWVLARPLGIIAPDVLSSDEQTLQLQRMAEARALITRSVAKSRNAMHFEILPSQTCTIEIDLMFIDNWHAVASAKATGFGCGVLPLLAMLREPDLVNFPRTPGVPYIESMSMDHEFAVNDFVHRIQGYNACLPGVDDVHNVALFDLYDEPEKGILAHVRSPPGDASTFRCWSVPPVRKGRKRNYVPGAAYLLKASGVSESSITVYGDFVLPVPRWMVPARVLRWALPKIAAIVYPIFTNLSENFTSTPFWQRVQEDKQGFYAAVSPRVGASELEAQIARMEVQ